MTITKKVLSLVLVLTMLLTMATFPSFAAGPKTVGIEASIRSAVGAYGGIHFLARPSDYNLKAGDKLTIADDQKIIIASGMPNVYLSGDTSNSDPAKQIAGLVINYGRSYNEEKANTVYVKVAADGTISGFYASMNDTTTTDIVLEEGIYAFSMKYFVNASGDQVQLPHATQQINHWSQAANPHLWSIEVKAADAPDVTAPDKADYEITTPDGNILPNIKLGADGVNAVVGDRGYAEEIFADVSFATSDAASQAKLYEYGKVRAEKDAIVVSPHGQFRVDFDAVSYVNELKLKTDQWSSPTFVVDVYGSMNGEDWYLIGEAGRELAVTGSVITIPVDAIVQNLRVYFRDYVGIYGKIEEEITSFTGQLGVLRVGQQAPTTCEVTFIDKTSLNPQDDVIVTVDIGSTVTVPTEFATGYKFYSDSACTTEIDITTATFSQKSVVYVKTETFNFPTYESNEVPKIVMLVKGPGDVAVLPDGVKVNVGDTLLFPVGKDLNSSNLNIGPWTPYHVSRLSSVDGSVDKNYYHTDSRYGTNVIPQKVSGQNSGVIAITEPGVYTVMQNNAPISEEIWVDTYAKGTYVTEAPAPDKAYAAQTHELYYDEATTMFTLPAGAVVRVGDTLKFSTTLPIADYGNPYPLVSTRQTIVAFDVNGNGYIDADEMTAIDSAGSDELDMLLKKGQVLITKTGIYAFSTVGGSKSSTWLAPITVNEYAVDPSLIEGSNEIIYEESSAKSSAVGMDTTEIVLNLKVKMAKGTVPAFTYSETATSESVTLLTEESTADYDMYLVSPVFAFDADTMDITVTYGDNFRVIPADTFSRKKSDEVFSTSLLEGDNTFYVSNLKPKFNATSSTLTYIMFEISTQQFVGGVTEGIINGVEYKDLKIELVDVISKSSRFEPFTLETFCYNPTSKSYTAALGIKAAGFDKFFATVQLTGINQTTKQYEVIEEKVFSTEMIEIIVKPADKDDNHRVGGADVPALLAQLEKVYADKNYVIIDCINDYLVDEDGKFMLDENGNKITNLAQKNPTDAVLWQIDDVLWNGLINMKKAYFEFRFAAPTNDPLHGRNHIIRDKQCIEYSIRIDKTSHNMIRLNENAFFRCGMRFNGTAVTKALKNSVKEQLGNGYDPLFINVSWWMASVPFTQTTFSITLPEEWTAINGTEDLKLYRYGNSNGTATLTLDREGLKVDDRFDNRLTFDISGQYFYSSYALVGANTTVERPGDSTAKHNVATGGADLVAAFATFATIALAAYGLKKRED